ncbi:MAG: Hint domain-containing protein, partial [Mangrovicoccus sp.]
AETVTGGLGDDSIVGDGGADSLLGEEGDDTIEGGSGDDTLSGGDGSDAIQGGAGYDTIYGGAGDDYLSGGGDGAEIHGDAGDDTIWNGDLGGWVDGGSGSDLIYADQGDDTLFGGDDADTFEINNTWGDFGADIITGGEGGTDIDHLDFSYMDRSVDVTATGEEAGTATDGTSTLTYSEIEIFSLSDYDDTFDTRGFNTGATVDAGAGADQLLGGNGDDSLVGGAGSDTLSGYAGNDTLEGGDDADLFQITDDHDTDSILGGEGGTDSDTLAFFNWASTDGVSVTFSGAEAGSYDFIDAAASGEGSFAEIEAFIGTAYGDVFDASAETAGIELVAGAGSDTISGGSGADSIAAGDDADTIYIFDGFGNDTIDGGEGSGSSSDYDVIDLSAVTVPLTITYLSAEAGTISDGTHTITFSNIENVIASGADDTIIGAATDDSLAGQAGDDVLIGGAGQDTLDGGADADLFQLSDITNGEQIIGGETVITGTDDDTLDVSGLGQAVSVTYSGDESGTLVMGTDTLTFVEIENIVLSDYGDTLDGSASSTGVNINSGSGDDSILGGTGQDTLIGGAGADTLLGGSEADSLIGGVGDDILTGGSHDDVFTYTVGDGNDTIADFNTGNSGTLSDGNASNNDFIDLSAFYGNIWELQADQADDGILNQSNDGVGGVDYSGNSQFAGGSLTFTGASADGSFFTVENTGVVCFAEGTRIRTAQGDRLVQDLRPGDLVQTMDNGVQKLLWVGRRHLSQAQLADAPNLRPVWLRSEAIGADAPLIVSPQHCLLMHINGQEHLVRARHLALMPGADAVVMRASQPVTYYHLLFERHEILFSNGAPTESFYPGRFAIAALGLRERLSLAKLFPDLVHQPAEIAYGPRARDVAKRQSLPKTLGRMAYSQA